MTAAVIGVAIGIPPPFGAELRAWRERFGDPRARLIIPHVTLVAPMEVPQERLPAIERHLAVVASRTSRFRITLRGTGTFRPLTAVVFVPLVRGARRCARLAEAVRSGPLAHPLRFPYHPHVTIAHDLDDSALDRASEALADYRADFDVTGFGLYRQDETEHWREVTTFAFGAPAPASVEPGDGAAEDGAGSAAATPADGASRTEPGRATPSARALPNPAAG